MFWTCSPGQMYAPWVATWWLTSLAGVYWWAGLSAYPGQETKAPQLRLVAVNGKLVRS